MSLRGKTKVCVCVHILYRFIVMNKLAQNVCAFWLACNDRIRLENAFKDDYIALDLV